MQRYTVAGYKIREKHVIAIQTTEYGKILKNIYLE